jgi:hypothetical protein
MAHDARKRRQPASERRQCSRYPIELTLHFVSIHGSETISGEGKSINISRNGMLFSGISRRLTNGNILLVTADWPAQPAGTHLVLFLHGQIVRTKGSNIAMSVARQELVPADD